ncbi:uncharacterized protein LOC109605600 isoform X1 [Aethina tumida]|uniref:uncharacterized protein LOC109605600 isoform X1 n=1 Tax=Aethina tumida TaxID=116153 RepID=UPI0021473E34|nr:uncharacterized protein LOC109605600 isoform X1 [Aethina tumida]
MDKVLQKLFNVKKKPTIEPENENLRPKSWKSESHLNQKQVNRFEGNTKDPTKETMTKSKSTDWTNVDLEVPDKETVHLQNPKLALIFNTDEGTPTPPPRKHKKGFREKIEAVAKSSLQAFQSKKPVEEEVCVKKKINFNCPYCDGDEKSHNRDHHHQHHHDKKHEPNQRDIEQLIINNNSIHADKKSDSKRRKNLSVVSLPNYNDLKLTVATFDDIDKKPVDVKRNSVTSLHETKKLTSAASTGKLDSYITRCRSFGSLIPQQIMGKLKTRKTPADAESDDSFGALEDWDLRIIEHYNPKDASLPRVRKLPEKNVLSDIESMIVQEEEIPKPTPPVRRSESLVKKINRQAQNVSKRSKDERPESVTPPPSPNSRKVERVPQVDVAKLPHMENGVVEHSSLMKILEEFSVKDASKPRDLASVLDDDTIPHIDADEEEIEKLEAKRNYSEPPPTSPTLIKTKADIDMFIRNEGNDTLARHGYVEIKNI